MPAGTIYFGIDPGTAATGYGVVKVVDNTVAWVDSGVICPKRNISLDEKLDDIFNGLNKKLDEYRPSCVCVEEAFYGKNAHTALILGHARGVALLAARKSGAFVVEFSPLEIKKAVVGNGNAQKEQVAFMVRAVLSLPNRDTMPDETDALAAALCAFYHRTSDSWRIPQRTR